MVDEKSSGTGGVSGHVPRRSVTVMDTACIGESRLGERWSCDPKSFFTSHSSLCIHRPETTIVLRDFHRNFGLSRLWIFSEMPQLEFLCALCGFFFVYFAVRVF